MIYFIENAGLIKIGYAANVEKRLDAFKTTLPALKLIGTMEGTRGHERTVHDCLATHRQGGEWFTDCSEVREFIAAAILDGVGEWKSNRTRGYKPSMWDERAIQLCEIICRDRPKSEIGEIEKALDIPARTLWSIRYRQTREVSVGEFFSLLSAAREIIKRKRQELDRDEAFVSDLEREETEKAGETLLAEARVIASERRLEIAGADSAAVRSAKATLGKD